MVGELNMRHSHATHDLYNRIAEGNPPEWTWYVQTMPVDIDLAEVGFDPLDDTKVKRSAVIFIPSYVWARRSAGIGVVRSYHGASSA